MAVLKTPNDANDSCMKNLFNHPLILTLTGLSTLSGRRTTNLSGCEVADRIGVQHAQNLSVISINMFILCVFILTAGMVTVKAQTPNPPVFIKSGTTTDPTTMKTITWMTAPTATPQAIMKIAKKAGGESSFEEVTGKTMEIEYDTHSGSSGANPKIPKLAYSVTVDGLEPGTTYIYQVGDGVDWSETLEFTTVPVTNNFTFFVFGDLHATRGDDGDVAGSTTWLRKIARKYEEPATKPLFAIQIGDLVDREHVYNYYKVFGDVCDDFPQFANTDIVGTMGNHEYYRGLGRNDIYYPDNPPGNQYVSHEDDSRGEISKFLYGTPLMNNSASLIGKGTYSVDYGNMHIIVLDDPEGVWQNTGASYTNIINAQAEWIRNDLENCDKLWKIVAMHTPMYEGGPGGTGENEVTLPLRKTAFGDIFDEFGVHFVFAGHTHIDRRIQVLNGTWVQSGHNSNVTPNAPTYVTCGNLTTYNSSTTYYKIDVDNDKMVFSNIRNDRDGAVGYSLTVRNWAKSLAISGAGGVTEITDPGGTLQMEALVLPEYASNKAVTWSITTVPAVNVATIGSSSGLLTARRNGTVTVTARTNDGSNISATTTITISGQPVEVTSVTVSGAGGASEITADGGTLQMEAAVLPDDATDKTVSWSITPETGVADITTGGLLTAACNGEVTVRATANDGSGRYGEKIIAISGQFVPVTSVTVSGAGGVTSITAKGGALQMEAAVFPEDATDKTVSWSVTPATGTAGISNSGLLTATGDGTVTVRATANDGSEIYGEAIIAISGQTVTGMEDTFFRNMKLYPNPFMDALRITGAENCTLRVMDTTGTVVHIQKITGANELIRLEQLAAGVYFFCVEQNGQTRTEKIVKE